MVNSESFRQPEGIDLVQQNGNTDQMEKSEAPSGQEQNIANEGEQILLPRLGFTHSLPTIDAVINTVFVEAMTRNLLKIDHSRKYPNKIR